MLKKLYLKQLAVDTPISGLGQRLRWIAGSPNRRRHPELWDYYLEGRRTSTALAAVIKEHHNCVDVGAHIGSVLAEIRRLAPGGSHVAFEPVPTKARWLRKKYPDVRLIEAATSNEAGTATFFESVDVSAYSGLGRPLMGKQIESYDVRLVSLDEELADVERVDFLKIDVEGNELPTLHGAANLIARDRPTMLFECGTDVQLEPFGYTRADLFDFFAQRDYAVYSVVDFVYGQAPMSCGAFVKAGTYPFRGFNYFALSAEIPVERLL